MYTKKRPPLKNEVTTRQGYDDPCCNTPLFQERDELFKKEEDWMIIVTSFLKAKIAIMKVLKEHVTINLRR